MKSSVKHTHAHRSEGGCKVQFLWRLMAITAPPLPEGNDTRLGVALTYECDKDWGFVGRHDTTELIC